MSRVAQNRPNDGIELGTVFRVFGVAVISILVAVLEVIVGDWFAGQSRTVMRVIPASIVFAFTLI